MAQPANSARVPPSARCLAATHRNLERAVEARRRDRSLRYAPRFRHGLYAISLQRSLALAGEKLTDYRAHLDWCRRVWGGVKPPCREPSDVAREDAPPRDEFETPPADWMAQPLGAAASVLTLATAIGFASWRRQRAFRLLAERERLTVCHCLKEARRQRLGGAELSAPGLAELLGHLESTLAEGVNLKRRVTRLNHRVEALLSRALLERGQEPLDGPARPSPVMESCELYPAEALGNPQLAPQRVMRALHRASVGVQVREPDGWRGWREGGGRLRFHEEDEVPLDAFGCDALLRRTREAGGELDLPVNREEFCRLAAEALGPAAGKFGAESAALGADRVHLWDDAKEARELGEALWERLELFRAQAEAEGEGLRSLREDYTSSLDHSLDPDLASLDAQTDPGAREMAQGLREVLESGAGIFDRALELHNRLRRACWALLVKRYGPRPEFEEFMPTAPDPGATIVLAKLLDATGRTAEARALLKEYEDYQDMKECLRDPDGAYARLQEFRIQNLRQRVPHNAATDALLAELQAKAHARGHPRG